MNCTLCSITNLEEAVDFALTTVKEHPERDIEIAHKAALAGKPRKYPAISINHLGNPEDTFVPAGEMELPEIEMPNGTEKELAEELISKLEPLKMLNPVNLSFNTGNGPGTLVTCFGIPLDPEASNTPAYTISIDEVLSKPMPDPRTTGLMPEIRDKIQKVKDHTPDSLKICHPDTQGPFNIAHSLVGDDALILPYTEPEKFTLFMEKITDFWIESVQLLREWIGPERMNCWDKTVRIAECSVNLISPDMYNDFVLPCDLRIRETFGPVGIHTCSGPHVFYGTLNKIPDIVYTESGYISMTAAGYTEPDEAMIALKGKNILLNIGQELHDGDHFETIRKDLDRYEESKRLLFNYTAMNLGKKDRPYLRDLHCRLDEYWRQKYA
jgi:hypothetical protein